MMKSILVFLLFGSVSLKGEDMKRPTQEDIDRARKEYKKILKIPAELRGIWTGTGEYHEYIHKGTYINSLNFCGEWFVEGRVKIILKAKEKINITYDVITNYRYDSDFGRDAYWINLKSIEPMTLYDLLFFKNSRKMYWKHFIEGKEIESVEYKYEKCPAEKK